MAREDIDVTVDHQTLTIKGTRKAPADVPEDQYRRVERRYGTFSRSFTLPSTVDASKVSADYKNGVLTVKLPYQGRGQAADHQRRGRGLSVGTGGRAESRAAAAPVLF